MGRQVYFFPIQGLIHHGNIATVTKQRAFNKAMITSYTEVIFIVEASESTLDIGDWKVLTQGGYSAHYVKYQTAKAFRNKCAIITTITTFIYTFFYYERYIFKINLRAIRWKKKKANLLKFKGV